MIDEHVTAPFSNHLNHALDLSDASTNCKFTKCKFTMKEIQCIKFFICYLDIGRYDKGSGGLVFMGRSSPRRVSGCLPNCMLVSCVIGTIPGKPKQRLKGTSQAEAVTLQRP